MTLKKADIAEAIMNSVGYEKKESAQLVESIFETIKQTLESGEDVLISGFGKFSVREKKERRGRNPQTGERIMLPSRKVVTFKCSDRLKDKLDGAR
jgi:integration host factor subunit alpha